MELEGGGGALEERLGERRGREFYFSFEELISKSNAEGEEP